MLEIDLKGKIAFVAGVGDDQGFGWAIAKKLKEAGAKVLIGVWPPVYRIFTQGLESGKFDANRKLSDGSLLEFDKIYTLDAVFDAADDIPEEIKTNKRYASCSAYAIQDVVAEVQKDFGSIDVLVHSLANAPEVKKPLLETSRKGYLEALSASSYSLIALIQRFGPIMNQGGSCLALTYLAGLRTIPGYGGGMSSAKAALESDMRTLAFEAGRQFGVRVNAISAGPYGSRAAKAIGFIGKMIAYAKGNAPLPGSELTPEDVGSAAAFLLSPMASAITGNILFVDHGLHSMGVATDSPALVD